MLGAAAGDAGTSARGASGREALTAPALPESRAGRRRSPRVWRLWHTLLTSAPLSCRSFTWRWSVLVSVLCVTCHREIKTTGRGAGTGPTELGRRRPHSLPRSRSSADRRLRGQTRRGSSVFAVRFGLSWELSFVTGDNTLSGLRRPPPARRRLCGWGSEPGGHKPHVASAQASAQGSLSEGDPVPGDLFWSRQRWKSPSPGGSAQCHRRRAQPAGISLWWGSRDPGCTIPFPTHVTTMAFGFPGLNGKELSGSRKGYSFALF